MNIIKKEDRFRQVLLPSFYLGLLTNLYIVSLLILINGYSLMLSPVIGSIIFLGLLIALLKNKISTKTAFYALAFTVSIEVIIHTHYLGWSMGFYYYLFLLNLIFVLNYKWSKMTIVVFNLSVFLIGFGLWYFYMDSGSEFGLSQAFLTNVNLINLVGTASIIIIIVVYYSRVLYMRDETLQNNMIALQAKNEEIIVHQKKQELLIKEVHHRVKNNLQIISSLMSLQSHSVKDEKVLDVLNQSRARIQAIAMIHQKLYQNDMVGQVDFKSYLADILSTQQLINDRLICKLDSTDVFLHLDIAVPLGIIVSELMTNSMKHAFVGIENPCLNVKLFSTSDDFTLIINDNGVGLGDDFKLENTTSLGMEIITVLIDQIDAKLIVSNEIGACFTINFKDKAS